MKLPEFDWQIVEALTGNICTLLFFYADESMMFFNKDLKKDG